VNAKKANMTTRKAIKR